MDDPFGFTDGLSRRAFLRRAAALGAATAGALASGGLLSRVWAAEPANVRVSDDGFTVHAEPSLAVDPRRPRNQLAALQVWNGPGRGRSRPR